MGLFSGVKNTWGKAQVAAIVQGLLELQVTRGLLDINPLAVSNNLVATTWASNPSLFEGKAGPKPHKASVAAFALSCGVMLERRRGNEDMQRAYVLALGMALHELRRDADAYPFHHIDFKLLEKAADVFAEEAEALSEEVESLSAVFPHGLPS